MSKKTEDKVKFVIPKDENDFVMESYRETKVVDIGGNKITVKRHFPVNDQGMLIKNYLDIMFDGENEFGPHLGYNRPLAEYNMLYNFLLLVTDLDVDSLPESVLVDESFFAKITEPIANWKVFRRLLDKTAEDAIRQWETQQSLGQVLDLGIQKFLSLIEGMDENIFSNVAEEVRKVGKAVEESNLSGLMDEGAKIVPPAPKTKNKKASRKVQ